MERRSKKIAAGMLAGCCVLSTESVLGSFQKLPMGGGHELISYAETETSGNTETELTVEALALDSTAEGYKNYKGTLKYKIKFNSITDNFAINTILRNSGVTKADGKAAISTDVSGKTSGDALTIIGTENFFKAAGTDGVSNLTRFKLKAKYKDANNVTQNEELSLNDPACITTYDADNTGYQPGNTYQIIGTGDRFSKLYWGTGGEANKLIFEIHADYMNEDYITDGKLTEDLDASNKSKGIEYTLNGDGTAEVKDAADDISGEVVIPDYVRKYGNKYKVTSIGASAFVNCRSLESLIIPDSVTSIGASAFRECSVLESVVIPDSVTSIGSGAFVNCRSLESLIIPDGVTSIGVDAFCNCTSLTSVVIPDGVTSIGAQVFYKCGSLTSITIPEGVTTIGDYAFASSGLTSVVIPDGVTSIGEKACQNCSSLGSVEIPGSVESIGDYAFYGCSALTSITIKSTQLSSVGGAAFSGLPSNGIIYVPDSKRDDTGYQALFKGNGLPSGWTFKKLSEKPAE